MSSSTLGLLGLTILIIGTIVMIAFSLRFMSSASRQTAEVNRQHNKPISNGYASLALIIIAVIFALTLVLGLLPPLLRRG